MNLMTVFKVRLAHIESIGYARTVQFATSLPSASSTHAAPSLRRSLSEGGEAHSVIRTAVDRRRDRMQIHRVHRRDLTPRQQQRRAWNRAYWERRKLAKLAQLALGLEQES